MSDIHSASKQQTATGGGGEFGMETAGERGDLEFDPVVPEVPTGKKPTGLLILLLVVGLAIGMLFSMKTLTKVSGALGRNSKRSEVESVVDSFLNAMGKGDDKGAQGDNPAVIGNYEDVVHVLTDNYTKNQVKDLGRDPFETPNGNTPAVASGSGNQLERAADKLVLKSVMGNSIANFNGRIVRVGQVFPIDLGKNEGSVEFKLTKVDQDSATVEAVTGDPEKRFERTVSLRRNN